MIIGTTALCYHGVHLREPSDLDIMSTIDCKNHWDTIIVTQEILDLIPSVSGYATVDAVYTIKQSHLGWDIKWKKHYNDVLKLSELGAEIIPDLYTALVKHWTKVNGNNEHLSLYKKKADFFNDAVPYVYDHDFLHSVVAYPFEPVYKDCLQDGQDVMIDKVKFFAMPLHLQLRMFKEEVSVIAAERWLINPACRGKYHWLQAYDFALHKTITALTKGWATDFMLKHLDFFRKPDYTYFFQLFNRGIIMSKTFNSTEKEALLSEVFTALDCEDESSLVYQGHNPHPDYDVIEKVGGEDEGSYAHLVFKWKDQLYKLTYRYYSYDGFDFDYSELEKVEAVQKTITVFE